MSADGVKRVLVTGAGKRVGRHIALALGRDGWDVAVHYNTSSDAADEVVELIQSTGGTAEAIGADLSDRTQVVALVSEAAGTLGGTLTALVNNASVFVADTADNPSHYAENMAVNLRAPLLLSAEFANQTDTGVILHMLDQRVLKPNPLYFTYSLSKASLYWAMKTQAQTLAPGIRVVGVGPGPTLRNTDQADGEFEAEAAATLLGNGSPPETIVECVRYLLGAEAVTGQMIAVDGGQHLTWQTPDLTV